MPFEEAVAQTYEPFSVGTAWGRGWSTLWLHITGSVPAEWVASGSPYEIVIDLGFRTHLDGSQAEGLAFRPDGTILKAIEPFNCYLPVEDPTSIDIYLEAAANPEVAVGGSWHPTPFASLETVPDTPLYVLNRLDLAQRNLEVWELNQDIEVLAGLVEELPADLPRRAGIVVALNAAMDAVDPRDVAGTATQARAALAGVLARPANASAHRVLATGHAHIDSAWLWPVRETVRKCARTFANVIALTEEHPDLVFSCSSAQQYAWIKASYPELWERLKQKVAEGCFVPVGGMWVESDTNMPGSEALARQFIHGKGFFLREFGYEPTDVWLPDSFGYSGALPQVAVAAGSRYFLTQKMSWNETNVLPHHTFWWEGIDGTRIFTHLPPVDTYNSRLAAFELAKAERQYAEQGHGTISLVPFGYGDGGGGPTREMVARAHRTADLEGSPKVRIGTAEEFFTEASAELPHPGTWSGEMYLETHRGTYTSQLRTKQGNRRSEHLLRAAELWATTAAVRVGLAYPTAVLQQCWETVLLQQFHDILPGSSIAWVHREAEANYVRVAEVLEGVITRSLAALTGDGATRLAVNSSPVSLAGIEPFAVSVPPAPGEAIVTVVAQGDGWVVDTGVVRVVVDGIGTGPLPALWSERWQAAGVQWHVYNPARGWRLLMPKGWRRLHRKLCVVDGDIGFAMGDGDDCLLVKRDVDGVQVLQVPKILLQPGELGCAAGTALQPGDQLGQPTGRHRHVELDRHALGAELLGDSLGDQLSFGLGILDLEDVELNLLTRQLLEIGTDALGLGATATDHDTRAGSVDVDADAVTGALNLDAGNARAVEARLQKVADLDVFGDEIAVALSDLGRVGEPARHVVGRDSQTETVRIYFLAHYFFPALRAVAEPVEAPAETVEAFSSGVANTIVMWLVRFRIWNARPCARA